MQSPSNLIEMTSEIIPSGHGELPTWESLLARCRASNLRVLRSVTQELVLESGLNPVSLVQDVIGNVKALLAKEMLALHDEKLLINRELGEGFDSYFKHYRVPETDFQADEVATARSELIDDRASQIAARLSLVIAFENGIEKLIASINEAAAGHVAISDVVDCCMNFSEGDGGERENKDFTNRHMLEYLVSLRSSLADRQKAARFKSEVVMRGRTLERDCDDEVPF